MPRPDWFNARVEEKEAEDARQADALHRLRKVIRAHRKKKTSRAAALAAALKFCKESGLDLEAGRSAIDENAWPVNDSPTVTTTTVAPRVAKPTTTELYRGEPGKVGNAGNGEKGKTILSAATQKHTKFFGIRGEPPSQIGKKSPQIVWRGKVLSADGPKGAIRRSVACAVGESSKPDGTPYRNPGQQRLADAAGVSLSTVKRHLRALWRTGWLHRRRIDDLRGTRGRYSYLLTIPPKKNRKGGSA
jgi:hypothetical protein